MNSENPFADPSHPKSFQAFGRRFNYEPQLGERCIEVPLAIECLSHWNPERTIEVGAVMVRHMPALNFGKAKHRVVDLTEVGDGIENRDALHMDYTGLNVLSISTLEHFDSGEFRPKEITTGSGMQCLNKIVSQSIEHMITFPIGFNPDFDREVQESSYPRWMFKQVAHYVWEQLPQEDWSISYGAPLNYGNAIVVISNCAWIANA